MAMDRQDCYGNSKAKAAGLERPHVQSALRDVIRPYRCKPIVGFFWALRHRGGWNVQAVAPTGLACVGKPGIMPESGGPPSWCLHMYS
jgi:hypothetical protein